LQKDFFQAEMGRPKLQQAEPSVHNHASQCLANVCAHFGFDCERLHLATPWTAVTFGLDADHLSHTFERFGDRLTRAADHKSDALRTFKAPVQVLGRVFGDYASI